MQPIQQTEQPKWLKLNASGRENLDLFYVGAYDIEPFKADLTAAMRWERASVWLVRLGWLSLAAGLGVGILAKGHRLFGLLSIPAAISCYFFSCKAFDRYREGCEESRRQRKMAEREAPTHLYEIYRGMKRCLLEQRRQAEDAVIREFNEAAPERGATDRWRPKVEGEALATLYEQHILPFGKELGRLQKALDRVDRQRRFNRPDNGNLWYFSQNRVPLGVSHQTMAQKMEPWLWEGQFSEGTRISCDNRQAFTLTYSKPKVSLFD